MLEHAEVTSNGTLAKNSEQGSHATKDNTVSVSSLDDEETKDQDKNTSSTQSKKPPFQPIHPPNISLPGISLPSELWLAVLQCPCTFPSEIFSRIMLNLMHNPNITSSNLFRADILYDSEKDPSQTLLKGLKAQYRPRECERWEGFEVEKTMVRMLVPRNPKLDRPIAQTCHFLRHRDGEKDLVIYIPHVDGAEEMPFYHPSVQQLGFLHTPGSLTILYNPFQPSPPTPDSLDTKLHRTALSLLTTLHKHGQGQLLGYTKRVHHDRLIPQSTYQNTYTALKLKYGKKLSEQWVEVTDPGKHVFEDIGIATFLVELWRGMFRVEGEGDFPGFVDIGCGNGLLTSILLSEGYQGYGFDARNRKTWSTFPETTQSNLKQQVLVPSILQHERDDKWHDGLFKPGTFIISNHADELTAWTPLLAYLNGSNFIAIPCCSHDLSGARFRAPVASRGMADQKGMEEEGRLPQQDLRKTNGQAAETGSLKKTPYQKKMPSAYSSLCSYVASLAAEVGFEPEEDVLRIPSTRNSAIIGRHRKEPLPDLAERERKVKEVVERELRRSVDEVGREWIERAEKLMKKPGSGH